MATPSVSASIKIVDGCVAPRPDASRRNYTESKTAQKSNAVVFSNSGKPVWKGLYRSTVDDRSERIVPVSQATECLPSIWKGRGRGPDLLAPDRLPTAAVPCNEIWLDGQKAKIRLVGADGGEDAEIPSYTNRPPATARDLEIVSAAVREAPNNTRGVLASYKPEMFSRNAVEPTTFLVRQQPPVAGEVATTTTTSTAAALEAATRIDYASQLAKQKLHRACRLHYPNGALGLVESPYTEPGEVYAPIAARQLRQQAREERPQRGAGGNTDAVQDHLFSSHVTHTTADSVWRPCVQTECTPADHFCGAVQVRDEDKARKTRLYYM